MKMSQCPFATGESIRLACRSGEFTESTAGHAPGYEQANLTVLPKELADSFVVYCERNPQPCPLLYATNPGDPSPAGLARDSDVRSDLPRYLVRNGDETLETKEITKWWNHDSVALFLGCSFGFEDALKAEGIPMRHIEKGVTVPMYITDRLTVPSGPFHGPLVVSMRPIDASLVQKTIDITRQYPRAHGAPVHWGDPSVLGIKDLSRPDFGDSVVVLENEEPVFWACGVTAQMALQNAGVEQWISHVPGCMFVTDLPSKAAS